MGGFLPGLAGLPPQVPQQQQPQQPAPETQEQPQEGNTVSSQGNAAIPNPAQDVALHVMNALSGGSGHPLDWARASIAGLLSGASQVGKIPEGGGFLTGLARGAAGQQAFVRQNKLEQQAQQQRAFENNLKTQQEARAEKELQIHQADSTAQRAMWNAQTLASTQTRQQNAARFDDLQHEDKLRVRQLEDNIRQSEEDQLSVLQAAGVDVTQLDHITGYDQITDSHAKQAGAGQIFAVPNGEEHKAGEDNVGAYMVPGDVWDRKITKPISITSGYTLDKDGKATPQTITAAAGTSVGTLLAVAKGAQKDLQSKEDQVYKQAQLEHERQSTQQSKAETGEAIARTNLTNEQAKQYLTDNTPNAFGDVAGTDPVTGAALLPKEAQKRYDQFNEKVLQPLETNTDKSWKMAQQAYGEYQAANGKLPTGAQSMLMLSNHLSTTFGNVKGARVTKDMIQEHLHARGVSDTALVAVQKLTNGDVLSPDQWKAFMDLISQSREFSYEGAIDNARAMGIGKSIQAWLPHAPAPGAKIDIGTAKVYMYAARGNENAARDAAKAAGWGM